MTVGKIKKVVAEKMGVTLQQLESRCRLKEIALARQIAMFYSYCAGLTRQEVGKKFDAITAMSHMRFAVLRSGVNAIPKSVRCWKVSRTSIPHLKNTILC